MMIQILTPPVAAQYRALMLSAYAAHPDAFTATVAERSGLPLSWWEARLGQGAACREMVVGALEDGQLLGVAGLTFESRPKTAHKANLFGMYVLPQQRGTGLARELVRFAQAQARARSGVRVLQLTVSEGNLGAEKLYRACGFVPFGLEPMAVVQDGQFISKLHMWCDLASTSSAV